MAEDHKMAIAEASRNIAARAESGMLPHLAPSGIPADTQAHTSAATSTLPPPATEKERWAREQIEIQMYDLAAWNVLIAEAQARSIEDVATVAIWEHAVSAFPSSGRLWNAYADALAAAPNRSGAAEHVLKGVFSRCLLRCPHLGLWRCYLRYIRSSKGGAQGGHEEVQRALEFAVEHIGLDVYAGPVWSEYIAFLKTPPPAAAAAAAAGQQEESQRMTAVRRAYQRAVVAPVGGVEQLWKDYEAFETSISRPLAKGLLAEYAPRHMAACAVSRERKKLVDKIDFTVLPAPPGTSSAVYSPPCGLQRATSRPTYRQSPTHRCILSILVLTMSGENGRGQEEEVQWVACHRLLAFERSNPQRVGDSQLARNMSFAYDQCLMQLHHYPDVWYEYATWHVVHSSFSSADIAAQVFERALAAIPDSEVLHFAWAELHESCGRMQEARALYEALLAAPGGGSPLAHVQMMRYARRTGGVDAARKAFMAARRAPACSYHVYVASALMELCLDKDPKVARNVLELGLKKFIHEPAYIVEYADFLAGANDERNMRALFERALSVLPADKSKEVWNKYVECERHFGDLASLLRVEQRRRDALRPTSHHDDDDGFVQSPGLHAVAARYSFRDLWPCTPPQLAHLNALQALTGVGGQESKVTAVTHLPSSVKLSQPPRIPVPASTGASMGGRCMCRPDVSQMVIYDPRQQGYGTPGPSPPASAVQAQAAPVADQAAAKLHLPPALSSFLLHLPNVPGPFPDADFVISMLMQAELPLRGGGGGSGQGEEGAGAAAAAAGVARPPGTPPPPQASAASRHSAPATVASKRKEHPERKVEKDGPSAVLNKAPPRDIFRMRQLHKARSSGPGGTGTGSAVSGGSYSGDRRSSSS
eukprot:jgi/Mesen1/3729/ME000203S02819